MNRNTPATKKAIKAMFPKNLDHDEFANHMSVLISAMVNMMVNLAGAKETAGNLRAIADVIEAVTENQTSETLN